MSYLKSKIYSSNSVYNFNKLKLSIFSFLPLLTTTFASFPLNRFYHSTHPPKLAPICYSVFDNNAKQTLPPNIVEITKDKQNNFCINNPENFEFTPRNNPEKSKMENTPKTVYRADYTPPNFSVESVYLTFDLDIESTIVEMEMKFNKTTPNNVDMILNGEEMALQELKINDQALSEGEDYLIKPHAMIIFSKNMPSGDDHATLYTKVKINPKANSKLLGLYASNQMLCTQNEAEGFRRITYFFDRPDVMTKYTVKMSGSKSKFPILLSNGNKIAHTEDGESHTAIYEDPFPKPSYLFALVAGQLESISSTFTTMSGKIVNLFIYSEPENINKLDWAMESLKISMKWDEDVFGLEYDLNEFNIVAVNDFNMGAMENKSLNIFNTVAVLASHEISTDRTFEYVRHVIAHEYFHNWTGNRVTCRDWFQLTLKEGLTVYRHQTFNYMTANPSTKRIDDIKVLRSHQFPEDSGPLAHPIRPDSYKAIENFYTITVYEKGAEVIRMYEVLLGKDGFRKGMDLYFQRHDGQAVTCDDFRAAMADANNHDLTQFEQWYSQSGTPKVTVTNESYNSESQEYSITFQQSNPQQKVNNTSPPLVIPIKFCLIGKNSGSEIIDPTVLVFDKPEQTFTFGNITEPVIPSLFRNFSAPIQLDYQMNIEDSLFMAIHDTDAFTKWDSFQKLFVKEIYDLVEQYKNDQKPAVKAAFVDAFKQILTKTKDKALIAYMISIPPISELGAPLPKIDLDNMIQAKKFLSTTLANEAKDSILEIYNKCMSMAKEKQNWKSLENEDIENRQLANLLLSTYITKMDPQVAEKYAFQHFSEAKCLNDKVKGFDALSTCACPQGSFDKAIDMFYEQYKGEPLLINFWFTIQGLSEQPDTLERVEKLLNHKDFNYMNPNRMRSLILAFASNFQYFHDKSGKGYAILENAIKKVDPFNSIMSSAFTKNFMIMKKMDDSRQALMKKSLENILDSKNLSKEVTEIALYCLE